MFKLDPENDWRATISCKQMISKENLQFCDAQNAGSHQCIRAKHELKITNHTLDRKFLLHLTYQVDTPCVAICHDIESGNCSGGHIEYQLVFPITQTYWRGSNKSIVRLICWQLKEEDPDFNLQIYMRAEAYFVNYSNPPEEEHYYFVVYGNKDKLNDAS